MVQHPTPEFRLLFSQIVTTEEELDARARQQRQLFEAKGRDGLLTVFRARAEMRLTTSLILTAALTAPLLAQGSKSDPAIEKLMTELLAALNKHDGAALEAFYMEDAVMMPPDAPSVRGRAGIRAYYERAWKAGTFLPMSRHGVESAISGTTAFDVSTITLGKGGDPSLSAKAVLIFKRSANTWKIAYDISNGDAPMVPTKK